MHDLVRPGHFLDIQQGAQRNHLVLIIPGVKLADRFRLNPERSIPLDVDLVSTVYEIEIIDIGGSKVGLQGVEHRIHWNVQSLGFLTVDIEVELGHLSTEAGE